MGQLIRTGKQMNLVCHRNDVEEQLKALFIKSMSGDKEAYEEFLNLAGALTKRYVFFMGGKRHSWQGLEDLHQEIILKIHQKKHTYRIDKPILPWLFAVTKHSFIDFYRADKRKPIEVEYCDDYLNSREKEPFIDFDELLSILSPKQRDLLLMIKVDGYSYNEVAKDFNVSVASLKTAVHRSLKSLKERILK